MSNRSQRRGGQAQKVAHMPTYNMNQHQVEEMSQQAIKKEIDTMRQDILEKVTIQLSASFLVALHESTGFGQKRLTRVLERVQFLMQAIVEGEIDIQDLVAECSKLGVEVV